ncbi:bifunctional riboflavin kinase/FAD synthetase [Mumia sp. zg.B53]|uniref:bifunctional riboflavin kinase/FAD synthetase n=1 Tax=Mumia sp. zg.B53 TaxID=2855449 RepID=UPI0027E314AA|nr:bifunctional riboflavin kinase/FAD synthetase [Mumia sp. zg.B53]
MNVWRAIDGAATESRSTPSVATIGVFDGVHAGHRRVLARARTLAAEIGSSRAPVVAVTFDPHPTAVFAPDRAPRMLTTVPQRLELLRAAGADEVRVLAFGPEMAAWSPEEFVERILVSELRAEGVVVGDNFTYGTKAAGDVSTLVASGHEHGFVAEGVDLDGARDIVYSSTYVRGLIADGDVSDAARVLERPHSIRGVVVEGDKRGRAMGFPTANVLPPAGYAVPADGVYAGWLRRCDDEGEPLPAAISVGSNPTFDGVQRRVESYILDRDDLELYGVEVEVSFVARIRGQVRFDGMDALVQRMHRDVAEVRDALQPH